MRCAGSIQLDELHLARDYATITGAVSASILNGVLQIHQRPRLLAWTEAMWSGPLSLVQAVAAVQHLAPGGPAITGDPAAARGPASG